MREVIWKDGTVDGWYGKTENLADMVGLSHNAVKRHFKCLTDKGYLARY